VSTSSISRYLRSVGIIRGLPGEFRRERFHFRTVSWHAMRMSMSLHEATALLTAPGAPYELASYSLRGQTLRFWKNVPATLRELVLHSRQYGNRIYLVYEDERLSYAETFARVAALAQRLVADFALRKGDRVALAMRNYPEWPIAFWAATSVGAVVVPLNAWWTGEELAYGIEDSGARILIADAERVERLVPHLAKLPIERVIVARAGAGLADGHERFERLVADASSASELPDVAVEPDEDATIFYTSGTTGRPKGALGTHRNMVTNIGSAAFVRARAALRKGLPLAPTGPDAPQLSTLISVPLFHVTGSHSNLAYGTHIGAKLVLMYKWSPERALELIEREQITNFGGVPAMAWQVIESPDFERRDTSSVVGVNYGGAPAAPELVRRIKQAFPTASASNGYGLTETSAIATSNNGIDYERKPASIGLPVPICDAKVVDEQGRTLAVGDVGELCIRGANVVKGYWNKPEATAQSFRDGWLHTGDLVSIDDEGFVFVLDRAKDMLIRGGENVYCVEVENVLYAHPAVIDAAVIGIPHRVLGEEVGAVVQIKPDAGITAEELRRYAAAHLAAFKVPVRIELRVHPLPRNPNGKILKRQLREELGLV
jgi:long-chain acyl-CoA synthetase